MAYGIDTPENVEREIERTANLLRRMAAEMGRTPTTAEYKRIRAQHGCAYYDYFTANGVKWTDIVDRAGLEKRKPGHYICKSDRSMTAENIEAINERREHESRRKEWPLRAIYTRTEVREYPLRDGSGVYRVTRTYASLR